MSLTRRQMAIAIGVGAVWGLLSALLAFPPPPRSPAGYRWMPMRVLFPAWLVCLVARGLPFPLMGVFLTRSGLQLQGGFFTALYVLWSVVIGAGVVLGSARIIVPLLSKFTSPGGQLHHD